MTLLYPSALSWESLSSQKPSLNFPDKVVSLALCCYSPELFWLPEHLSLCVIGNCLVSQLFCRLSETGSKGYLVHLAINEGQIPLQNMRQSVVIKIPRCTHNKLLTVLDRALCTSDDQRSSVNQRNEILLEFLWNRYQHILEFKFSGRLISQGPNSDNLKTWPFNNTWT